MTHPLARLAQTAAILAALIAVSPSAAQAQFYAGTIPEQGTFVFWAGVNSCHYFSGRPTKPYPSNSPEPICFFNPFQLTIIEGTIVAEVIAPTIGAPEMIALRGSLVVMCRTLDPLVGPEGNATCENTMPHYGTRLASGDYLLAFPRGGEVRCELSKPRANGSREIGGQCLYFAGIGVYTIEGDWHWHQHILGGYSAWPWTGTLTPTTLSVTYSHVPQVVGLNNHDESEPWGPMSVVAHWQCGAITLGSQFMPEGVADTTYPTIAITRSGGVEPVAYSVTSGSLPAGLSLSTDGAISGTPTEPGTFAFTLTATDAHECQGSRAYTIHVEHGVPSLTSLDPPAGAAGTSIGAVLGGTGLLDATAVTFSGSGVTAAIEPGGTNTSLPITITIAPGAAVGERTVEVTTPGGTSPAFSGFTVTPPPPDITGITPPVGPQGSVVSATVRGSSLDDASEVAFSGSGVTASVLTGGTGTSLPIAITIDPDAALGERTITVTTPGGASSPFTGFTVTPPQPNITAITPVAGGQGSTLSATVAGTNLMAASAVTFSGEGVTATIEEGGTATSVPITITIDPNAALGERTVTVTTPGGASPPFTGFTVTPPPPGITGITPSGGRPGEIFWATIVGSYLTDASAVTFSGDGVTATIEAGGTDMSLPIAISIDAGAALGERTLTVTTPGGTSDPFPGFVVAIPPVPPPPVITSITPSSASVGRVISAVLSGTSLAEATEVTFSGTGVSAVISGAATATSVPLTLTIAAGASLGERTITVTTPGGTSAPFAGFSVVPPAPALTGIGPGFGLRGQATDVTLTGTQFAPGATTIAAGTGIVVSNLSVASTGSLSATFTIAPNAALGARTITVTTPGGTSNGVPFTVADPFPDLRVTSTHEGDFAIGFDETYTVIVENVGTAPTTGPVTVVSTLPQAFGFVSAGSAGWNCAAAGQQVTCEHSAVMAVDGTAAFTVTVATDAAVGGVVEHLVSVATAGDLNPANNQASDLTTVLPVPTPVFVFSPSPIVAGQQATVAVTLTAPYPRPLSGTLTLGFVPGAGITADDPAIQFETGGRVVSFTIPTGALTAQFEGQTLAAPIGFQTGTIAGTLTFSGTLQSGRVATTRSPSIELGGLTIPARAPTVHAVDTSTAGTTGGFAAQILLSSTILEVTHVSLQFVTTPAVQLGCGTTPGCSVSGSTITLEVGDLFAAWFGGGAASGSLSTLRLPLSIQGSVQGTVLVRLHNSQGVSNTMSFPLP